MRLLLLAPTLLLSVACAAAGSSIPPQLVGIWARDGSEFRGEALFKGQALYIDTDGVGAIIGGDGRVVAGARMVITSFDPASHVLTFDLTEYGKVGASGALTYDPTHELILSPKDSKERYQRRASTVSPEMRKSLGLEPKEK
ncbi:MAG: hypothetical protein ACXWHB_02670 [Usitatibacter sp.]